MKKIRVGWLVMLVAAVLITLSYYYFGARLSTNSFISHGITDRMNFENGTVETEPHHDKWIVVTNISLPTKDVKYLAEISGWKVVVVGDKKTLTNWRYKDCIFLDIGKQKTLGFDTLKYLPQGHYARKNMGYLYAIAHGAKFIYETDDDNVPRHWLGHIILKPRTQGLMYTGKTLFNPYRHFGQPTLWPRGYPLHDVGENIATKYMLRDWKTPSIQQGIVSGDPDMDALFRLTRKKTLHMLNVSFDEHAPPVIVPAGVFSPFNSQNTMFMYEALWALLIPTTTTFRVCDIWRGYWAQRLLWEIDGNIGFFPPNAFRKTNAHPYMKDAIQEKDLYFETERLIVFLRSWKCSSDSSFFQCVVLLSHGMSENAFWKSSDVSLTMAWINDLKKAGYPEPKRATNGLIPGYLKSDSKAGKNSAMNGIKNNTVYFSAVLQTPPSTHSSWYDKGSVWQHIEKITSLCRQTSLIIPALKHWPESFLFPNILLIIVFNYPFYENIPFLETVYRMHFPNIIYCGNNAAKFKQDTSRLHLQNQVTFVEVNVHNGWLGYKCLERAISMQYSVDGYLYIGDDTLLNVWNLGTLPKDKIWFVKPRLQRHSMEVPYWPWFNKKDVGSDLTLQAKNDLKFNLPDLYRNFSKMLLGNTKYKDGCYNAPSDVVYIPARFKDVLPPLMRTFSKYRVILEIAVPTVVGGLDRMDNIITMTGLYLWYDGKRDYINRYFREDFHFMHPVKPKVEMKKQSGIKFYCETYLPLTLLGAQPRTQTTTLGRRQKLVKLPKLVRQP